MGVFCLTEEICRHKYVHSIILLGVLQRCSVSFVAELFAGGVLLLVERISNRAVGYRPRVVPVVMGRHPGVGAELCRTKNSHQDT